MLPSGPTQASVILKEDKRVTFFAQMSVLFGEYFAINILAVVLLEELSAAVAADGSMSVVPTKCPMLIILPEGSVSEYRPYSKSVLALVVPPPEVMTQLKFWPYSVVIKSNKSIAPRCWVAFIKSVIDVIVLIPEI